MSTRAVRVEVSGEVFYRNWESHVHQWSEACYRGGDGQCDGTGCNCECHRAVSGAFADAYTVEQMREAHRAYWERG